VAEGLSHAIGEALLLLVEFAWPAAAPRFDHFAREVADAVRPEPPFTVTTQDGETITGLLVLERGRALLFFGTRHPAAERPAPEPPYGHRGFAERGFDADQPLWSPRPYTR
jgi:hypothetical protein